MKRREKILAEDNKRNPMKYRKNAEVQRSTEGVERSVEECRGM